MPGPPSESGREWSDRWRELSWLAGSGQEVLKPARGVRDAMGRSHTREAYGPGKRFSVGQLSWA